MKMQKSVTNLTDVVEAGSRNSTAFDRFDDFMRENSSTWRSESRNYFTTDELADALMTGIFGTQNSPYTVSLSAQAIEIRKGDEFIASIQHDGNAAKVWTLVVETSAPTAPAGFEVKGGYYFKTVRHVSDAFKAAAVHSSNVRVLIDRLRIGSNTFRQNYDHSYVSGTEMIMAAMEFSKSPQSVGWTVTFDSGRMVFSHGGAEVIGIVLLGGYEVYTPMAANAGLPEGWTAVAS